MASGQAKNRPIYLGSEIKLYIYCCLKGFSCQQITSVISFWSSVCVCTIWIDVKLLFIAGGRWGTLQSAANEDAAMLRRSWGGLIFYRCCFIWSMSTVIIRLYITIFINFHSSCQFICVFLHVRCIPHQDSQRLFWASVCGTWWTSLIQNGIKQMHQDI